MSEPTEQLSPAELVQRSREAYGLTWKEMGAAMNRSPRMIQKIARGESSGESYRGALTELYERGTVSAAPPRRRNAAGKLVPVRAKAGAKKPTITPRDTRPGGTGRSVGAYRSETVHLPDGNRIHHIVVPKGRGPAGRDAADREMRTKLTNIARGTRWADKRVRVRATVDIGGGQTRTFDVGSKGGYLSNDIVADIRSRNAGSVKAWVSSQVGDRYAQDSVAQGQLVGLSLTTFNATRSKEERVAQDAAGTRRWGRRGGTSRWK